MTTAAELVPWWYVAALAGGFTLLGALISMATAGFIARRNNKLADLRRFEDEIVAAYVRLDQLADVLHNNAGGDVDAERETFWATYREVLQIRAKMEVIASPEIYSLVDRICEVVSQMRPHDAVSGRQEGMPELVEALRELLLAVRRRLRVERGGVRVRTTKFLRRSWSWLRYYRWSTRPRDPRS